MREPIVTDANPFYPKGGAKDLAKLAASRRLWPDRPHDVQFSVAPFDKDLVCRRGFVPGSPEAARFGLHDVLINLAWDPERRVYRMVVHCGENMNISEQPHLLGFYGILKAFVREQHLTRADLETASRGLE